MRRILLKLFDAQKKTPDSLSVGVSLRVLCKSADGSVLA